MLGLRMSALRGKADIRIRAAVSANDPQRTLSAVPLSKQCLAVPLRGPEPVEGGTGLAQWFCHATIELAVTRSGARGLRTTAVQGLTHQGKEPSSPSRFTARGSAACFAHWSGPI